MFRFILAVLIGTLCFADLAVAQTSEHERAIRPEPETLAELSDRLSTQKRIRVSYGASEIELLDPVIGPEGINGTSHEGARIDVVAWDSVHAIQVRRSAWLRGATVGAATLGILGLIAGIGATGECQGFDFYCDASAGDVLAMTVLGAGAGFAIGGLLAAPFSYWSDVYKAPRSAAVRPGAALSPRGGAAWVSVPLGH